MHISTSVAEHLEAGGPSDATIPALHSSITSTPMQVEQGPQEKHQAERTPAERKRLRAQKSLFRAHLRRKKVARMLDEWGILDPKVGGSGLVAVASGAGVEI